jgi:hypothetical protein
MELSRVHKYARLNTILLVLKINIELYLTNNNFGLTIVGLNPGEYSVEVLNQKATALKEVACRVDYTKSIAGKEIQLNYDTTARRRMLLNTINLQSREEIEFNSEIPS